MSAEKRLDTLRRFLAHAHERMRLDFGFQLWDGSRVPANYPADGLLVALADEGVVAGLIRAPNLDTFANLWASGRLDIKNGTIFDFEKRRPKLRTAEIPYQVDWWQALGVGLQYLFVSRGGPWPLESVKSEQPSSGDPAENKQNIGYHYDVSNDFYGLWLDREMVYTCAYFHDWAEDIHKAQLNKLEMSCRRLRLKPGDTVLDLGCGWGAFSCYAAQNYGVKCYGVTLSEQQVAYANEKIKRLGLEDRVKIELRDYSTVRGKFDKVAAIGMLEHVGIDNHPKYFKTVRRNLKDGGLFLHHAITRPNKKDDRTFRRKRPEFAALTKYIFPGGELDYIGMTVSNLERYGFEVHEVEGWREHYQRTCKLWHDRLIENMSEAERLVGKVTARLWLIYLAGCSISFERNGVCLYQTLASKRQRGSAGLPPTRADLYR